MARKVHKLDETNGGLQILQDGLQRDTTWESTSSRSSSSIGHRPPSVHYSDSSTRRTPTPSKQIHLQAARKKDTYVDTTYEPFDWKEYHQKESEKQLQQQKNDYKKRDPPNTLSSNPDLSKNETLHKSETIQKNNRKLHKNNYSNETVNKENSFSNKQINGDITSDEEPTQYAGDSSVEQMLKMCYKKENVTDLMDKISFTEPSSSLGATAGLDSNEINKTYHHTTEEKSEIKSEETSEGDDQRKQAVKDKKSVDIEDSDEFDTDLDEEDESGDNEEEKDKRKAPNELLMEFLDCVMKKDWPNAQKLCTMILLFEPGNPEAKKFQGLIEEKVQIEKELAEESSSDFDSDDEEESGSEESGSEDDSDESSSEEDDEETSLKQPSKADSGIASISSACDHKRY